MSDNGTKKICIVTNSFPRYSSDYSGRFVQNLVIALSGKYEMHVIYPSNVDEPHSSSETFHWHQIPYPFLAYPMSEVRGWDMLNAIPLFFKMLVKIREVIRTYHIDLIHAYWAIPSGFVAALCCGKKPLIITLPGSDIKIFARKWLFRYPVKHALKKTAAVITRSNDLKQKGISLGAHESKISIIPAGVDLKKFRPMDKKAARTELGLPDGFLMLFAGSLIKKKKVDKLISVCAKLNGVNPRCSLLIAGEGMEKGNLQSLVEKLNLKNVLFVGQVPHEKMPGYMAASDALVLASESEGLPGCVQEAMACGIPVVATAVGGIPEIITSGVNGFLVNDEGEMEERLKLLMTSPHLVTTLGANAAEFARHNLSFDMVVKRTEELYASLPGEKVP